MKLPKLEKIEEQKVIRMSDDEFFMMYAELDAIGTKLLFCAVAGLVIAAILLVIALYTNTFFVFSAFIILLGAYMLNKQALKYKTYTMQLFKLRHKNAN